MDESNKNTRLLPWRQLFVSCENPNVKGGVIVIINIIVTTTFSSESNKTTSQVLIVTQTTDWRCTETSVSICW